MKKLNIIYEDGDVIVINKPTGLTVHPKTQKDNQETLVNLILKYYPQLKKVGDNALRPGIVHRLDKETSGLMVIAKNQKTFNYLKKQFKNRKVEKKYLALVIGQLKSKTGEIKTKLGKYKTKQVIENKRRTKIKEFKEAVSKYRVKKEFLNYSLLEVMPKTGRTHQIRVHLASIGHPIVGDKIYGFKNRPVPKNLKRQFLHAAYLKFSPQSGKILAFKCDLPKDLKEVLNKLKHGNQN